MKRNDPYNPYQDAKLYITQPEPETVNETERKPMNDAVNHFDVVNGVSSPKHLRELPKAVRAPFKLYVLLSVGLFVLFLLYSFSMNLWAALHDK